MGKLKLYQAGKSFLSWDFCIYNSSDNGAIAVPTYKDVNGTTHSIIYKPFNYRQSNGAYSEFNNAYACTDVLENKEGENYPLFNSSDYTVNNAVGTTSISTNQKTDGLTSSRCTFTVTVNNSNESDITVNCIKLTKGLNSSGSNGTRYTSLYMAYFFDESITIGAGQTKVFTFAFDWDKE